MAVYAKHLSPAWRKAFAEFESISGFEMMHQDEIDAGTMTPYEAWTANQKWFEDVYAEVQNIRTPFDMRVSADRQERPMTRTARNQLLRRTEGKHHDKPIPRRIPMCEECGKYPADWPSSICVGCDAYHEHQR